MSEVKRVRYNGLDVLKFCMAICVVAIHTKPFITNDTLHGWVNPLLQTAVPVFFTISSFLLFKKLNKLDRKEQNVALVNYIKRIGLLYAIWFVIEIPYTLYLKGYFIKYTFTASLLQLIKDTLFATTFPGSWFLSAMTVAIVFVFFINRYFTKYTSLIISFAVYFYIYNIELFNEQLQTPYLLFTEYIRPEIKQSFPVALLWVTIGSILSSANLQFCNAKSKVILLCSIIVLYMTNVFAGELFIIKTTLPILIFISAVNIDIKDRPVYKKLREMSIIIFFVHFIVIKSKSIFIGCANKILALTFPNHMTTSATMGGGNVLITNILFFIATIIISSAIAYTIITLEKKKRFSFLKYIH